MPEPNAQTVSTARARSSRAKRRSTLLAAALLASLCLPAVFAVSRRVFAVATTPQDYSRFSHSSPPAHAALTARSNCTSCHRQSNDSPEPRFPVHKDCTGCHLAQFTASISASNVNPICTVCHNQDDLNASNTRPKKFPGLRSFTAEFDHAQHMQGSEQARPAEGCVACHTPILRGVAQSIPARLGAHQTCYRCHSPGRQASAFSSCGSCHALGAYSPTPVAARAYRVRFSHADHGPRRRLTCENCHVVRGRGLPQRRQVSSILPSQHFSSPRAQSCMTCHNGRRAFGDTDTRDCRRCHSGPGFRMRG